MSATAWIEAELDRVGVSYRKAGAAAPAPSSLRRPAPAHLAAQGQAQTPAR